IPTLMSKARRLLMGKCNISSNETQDQRPLTTASFAFISSFIIHPSALPQSADRAAPRCSTQRAGIAPPHAEGDGLSGVTSERETFAFISGPAGVVGGVPLTRAMNPWAMPEAST